MSMRLANCTERLPEILLGLSWGDEGMWERIEEQKREKKERSVEFKRFTERLSQGEVTPTIQGNYCRSFIEHSRRQGETPLHEIAFSNDIRYVHQIALIAGRRFAYLVNIGDSKGQTPVIHAVSCGNSEALTCFIELGADVNVSTSMPPHMHDTALGRALTLTAFAAEYRLVECIKILVTHGAFWPEPPRDDLWHRAWEGGTQRFEKLQILPLIENVANLPSELAYEIFESAVLEKEPLL